MQMRNMLFIGLALPVFIFGQVKVDILNDIAATIKSGNVKEISKFFDSNIEITLLDEEGTYSKAQAEQILIDFFGKNTPKSFELMHTGGSSKENSKFGIGILTTTKGVTYRTYFLVREINGKQLIQELRFEED